MNQKLWQKCVEFHGHECPGLAIGRRASRPLFRCFLGKNFRTVSQPFIASVFPGKSRG